MPALPSRARSSGAKMPLSPTHDMPGRDVARQPLAGGKRGLEGFQIAVVDADQPRFQAQRAGEFVFVMHFDQHVHAERRRRRFEFCGASVIDRGHDDEDAIGAVSARLRHLIGVVHEILAQHRQRTAPRACAQMIETALERRRVGQHRKAGGAACLIGRCQRGRIEIAADQALRRARLLDLGDQRIVAGMEPPFDRAHESRAGGRGCRFAFEHRQRALPLRLRDLLALVGGNLLQNISHRSTPRSADRAGPRPRRNRATVRRARCRP